MSLSLVGYAAQAAELAKLWEQIDSAAVFRPVSKHMPRRGETVLDIGAGTGRDAAAFMAQGCTVIAVEPVGALWRCPEVERIDDRLPVLARVCALGVRADVILLSGVWHHLDPSARLAAWPVLASLLAPNGRILMSLRHGPSAEGRPAFALDPQAEIDAGARFGLEPVLIKAAESVQPGNRRNGVTWTWLCLRRALG